MKKIKISLILTMLLLFSSVIFLGCQSTVLLVDASNRHLYHHVFFYYNGGTVNNYEYAEYYIDKNGRLSYPSSSGPINNPTLSGYDFAGWYQVYNETILQEERIMYKQSNDPEIDDEAYTDEFGNIVYETVYYINGYDFTNSNLTGDNKEYPISISDAILDKDGNFTDANQVFIKKWNFDFDRVTDDIKLVALWSSTRKFVFVAPEHRNLDFDAENYEVLKDAYNSAITADSDEVCWPELNSFSTDGSIPAFDRTDTTALTTVRESDYKIEGFYLDPQCTQPVPYANRKYYPAMEYVSEGSTIPKVFRVYLKLISEKYTIIENASALNAAGSSSKSFESNANLYIVKDLDFTGVNYVPPDTFSGEIRGNGKSWFNLSVSVNLDLDSSTYGGLFKNFEGTINNVRYRGLHVTANRIDPSGGKYNAKLQEINLFAAQIGASSTVRNVSIGITDDDRSDYEKNLSRSTYTIVDYYEMFNVRADVTDDNGYLKYYSANYSQATYDETSGKYTYLDRNNEIAYADLSTGDGFNLTYLNEPEKVGQNYQILVDGSLKNLTKYRVYEDLPSAGNVRVAQNSTNFQDTKGVVKNCEWTVEEVEWAPFWEVTVTPETNKEPTTHADAPSTAYTFVGWYRDIVTTYQLDGKTYEVITPVQWNFDGTDFENITANEATIYPVWWIAII